MPGYVIYEGPNHYNEGEIAVIITFKSKNRKTGDMGQVWILPRNTLPTEALKSGEDYLVCRDCPLRPLNGGGCYVNVGQAPNAVWRAYKAGKYPEWDGNVISTEVRIGAYGDVGAIPVSVWWQFVSRLWGGYTCYTAQWRERSDLAGHSMASVQTWDDTLTARAQGWKTFRVGEPEGETLAGEILCPATRPGSRVQCKTCLLCDGNKTNVMVEAHGPGKHKVHNREEK